MKITDIQIKFIPDERPRMMVTFDKPLEEANLLYVAAKDKERDVWVYRGQDGDYVRCGVEQKPLGAHMKQDRVRMKDGWHPVWPFINVNSVAVNSLIRFMPPVMDTAIATSETDYIQGHCDVVAVAKYLYAEQSGKIARGESPGEGVAMAGVEWPSGIRLYEPVRITDQDEAWDATPNRACDKLVFLCTPDDKLTPLLRSIAKMEEPGTEVPLK